MRAPWWRLAGLRLARLARLRQLAAVAAEAAVEVDAGAARRAARR
jgi:hypothetical protein